MENQQNKFIVGLEQALREATKQDLSQLEKWIKQGIFYQVPEDLRLLTFLIAKGSDDGATTYTLESISQQTSVDDGAGVPFPALPAIETGLQHLEKAGFIRVGWSPVGIKGNSPFKVSIVPQITDDFMSLLEKLHKTFCYVSFNDYRRLEQLFRDHVGLCENLTRLKTLLYLMVQGSKNYTIGGILEDFDLGKDDRAAVANVLQYLKQQRLIEINWIVPDEASINLDRMCEAFKNTEEANEN